MSSFFGIPENWDGGFLRKIITLIEFYAGKFRLALLLICCVK